MQQQQNKIKNTSYVTQHKNVFYQCVMETENLHYQWGKLY